MSNTLIDFNVIDYTGSPVLSSYALSATPLLFFPQYTLFNDNDNRVVWNFGDGTISRSTSAYKYYEFPGKYTVEMVIYDCQNNSLKSIYTKDVIIYDFIPLTFNIDKETNTTPLTGVCGRPTEKITVRTFFPLYQKPIKIFYNVFGSNSIHYWANTSDKYNHLNITYNLYDLLYNNSISSYQYREIQSIETENVDIYAKVTNSNVSICDKNESGSFFVGMSGIKDVYYKDDDASDSIKIKLYFDKTQYNVPSIGKESYYNNLGITLSAQIFQNTPDHLSITSNGLDGEGYIVDSFNISTPKFYNTKIPFVIRVKDADNFSIKNMEIIELSSLNISLSSTNPTLLIDPSLYNIYSLNHTISANDHGGSFRGYIEFPSLTSIDVINDVVMSLELTAPYSLSGVSNSFSVYPVNYYDFYKKNEDFNPAKTLRDISFQEILISNDVLFDDFFGGVLGDSESTHDGIGLSIYEKIANYCGNISDVDYCDLTALESLEAYVTDISTDKEVYTYPEKLKRLVSLLSVDKVKLFGVSNKFNDNFDIRGRSSKDVYGKNIGDMVDTLTYQISAGQGLVALEKFSNTYTRLNTFQPVSAVGSHTYNLSAYSSDWGWPLVLPQPFNTIDFEKYYLFFEANDQYDGTILNGIVDFNNDKTTISPSTTQQQLFVDGGVYDNMFLSTLYDSLSLFTNQ